MLLININNFGFRELKIAKKNAHSAEYLVTIFKEKYFNKEIYQNHLKYINCKQYN